MNLKKLLFGKQLARIQAAQYQNNTQKWIPVADIRDGIIILKDGRYVKILEVLPVNFALKSPIERQNIIYYYASYLEIAPDNLQIKVVTQKVDIDGYVNRMWAFHEHEPVESCRTMIEDNVNEVTYLAANEAVTRRFFLVFQHEARMKTRGDTIQAIAERLREEEQTARSYLGMCGLEVLCPNYADSFHLELLYALLNKRTGRHTKPPLKTFASCTKVFGIADDELQDILSDEGSGTDETNVRGILESRPKCQSVATSASAAHVTGGGSATLPRVPPPTKVACISKQQVQILAAPCYCKQWRCVCGSKTHRCLSLRP